MNYCNINEAWMDTNIPSYLTSNKELHESFNDFSTKVTCNDYMEHIKNCSYCKKKIQKMFNDSNRKDSIESFAHVIKQIHSKYILPLIPLHKINPEIKEQLQLSLLILAFILIIILLLK